MSPKLFADDYEDDGEEALSRLALRGGGRGSLSCFLFHFFIASSFPNPLPLSFCVVYPAGGGEQGWRCGVCVSTSNMYLSSRWHLSLSLFRYYC